MTTAIIIVILILILSVILFFVIKQFSYVDTQESDLYEEEGSITDFNSVKQESKDYIDKDNNLAVSNSEVIKTRLTLILGGLYRSVNKQFGKLAGLSDKYKVYQANKRKEREQQIQEAIKRDQEELDSNSATENMSYYDADTSKFEVEATSKKLVDNETNNAKATNFVEQLLSEADALTDLTSQDSDISDTYYYEYMEKRYIDRIVANSKDIDAYKKLGALYIDMKNYKDALESFQYVLKFKSNDTIAIRRVKELSNRLNK